MIRVALIPILLLTPVLADCSLTDPEFLPGRGRNEILQGPGEETPEGKAEERHLWVSAVEYPEGYDWKRDTARGLVACRLVLFRDGDRVLELPVRDGISPDADMHRIAGGHLYTDFCTGEETVLCRDGKEIFRYKGRESLRGFFVGGDGEVHTLGQNRSGTGFSYRIDGKLIHEEAAGALFGEPGGGSFRSGAFGNDGDVSFGFGTAGGHYYLWRDGDAEEITLRNPQAVFDIRSVGRKPVAVYAATGNQLRICSGENDYRPATLSALQARILPDAVDGFRVFLRYRTDKGEECDAIIGLNGYVRTYLDVGFRVEALLDGNSFVGSDREGRVSAVSWKGTVDRPEAGRWTLIGPPCIWMDENDAWVALTGQPPDCPAIWHRGEMTTLLMNGYLTGVVYE